MIDLANLNRFPCDVNKKPMMVGWQRNAKHYDYARWPLVGVPTGERNGFDVLDIDVEGLGWWEQNREAIPRTQGHRTRSGGLHLLFEHHAELRCSAGRIALGIDVRADGGYVCWWPREGFPYERRSLAAWPDWLLALATRRNEKAQRTTEKAPLQSVHGAGRGRATINLQVRSDALLRRVEQTPRGERNRLLNWAAFRFGEMIAEGIIQRGVAEHLLEGAAKTNRLWREDGAAQCKATIASGIEAGIAFRPSPTVPMERFSMGPSQSSASSSATASSNGYDNEPQTERGEE